MWRRSSGPIASWPMKSKYDDIYLHSSNANTPQTQRKGDTIHRTTSGGRLAAGDDDSASWLRNELRRSEERMSRVVVQVSCCDPHAF
jgi:hypothetical protein